MMKNLLLTLTAVALAAIGARAQVTTSPSPVQEDTQNLTIYFHADQGNGGLKNLPQSTPVYAHTGVLTSKSTGSSDWKYAPTWGSNDAKYLMKWESANLYSLYIGDIRTYYGITDPSEKITKLAFVFRDSNGSKEGKTATNGDIFVDVLDAGLQVSLVTSLGDQKVITESKSKVTFSLGATEPSTLTLSIDNGIGTLATKQNATLVEATYTFTKAQTYTVTGTATNSKGETASTTLTLTYVSSSPQADFPGGVPKMGQTVNNDGSVTFCFAAPGKESVMMVTNRNDYQPVESNLMNYQDYQGFRYFWTTISDLAPDEQLIYYFLVDGEKYVGDPYAKLVLDPTNDRYISSTVYPDMPAYPTQYVPQSLSVPLAVYQGNMNDFDWTDDDFVIPDHDNLIIYELLFRDFTGTEGQARGNGTVKLAMEKLPYLKHLGVNVIELLPINEFNGNNSWGYNPNFYFAPDKAYGTPDDYKEFINACHELGIAVVLDMVFNQTDWLHPWYRLYDVGSNPFYNATAPHAYSVLNDWNQGYPLVRQQWKDVVKYWMEEYHIDGYRFDLVKGLGDNDSYANNGDAATNAYNASRVKNMRDIQEVMLEVNPDCIFINENLAGAKEENEMAAYGQLNWANLNNSGCQYAMGYQSDASLNRMLATNDGRTWGSTVSYLESHDEQRLGYKQITWGVEIVKNSLQVQMERIASAAAQMIMAPGSHMIWQFSELGNDENTKDNNGGNNTSPKKVLWSYYDVPDRRYLYYSYCELINLRLENPELFAQDAGYSLNYGQWNTGRYFHSSVGGKELHLLVNPELEKELTMNVAFGSTNQDDYYIASKYVLTDPTFSVADGTVTLPPNSYVLIVNNAVVNGVKEIPSDMAAAEPVAQEWYTLTGARVANPDKGIYVQVVRYADGTSRSFKVVR